jgi:DnaJ-class molecular chaperone
MSEARLELVESPCPECGGRGTVTMPGASEREYLEGLMEDQCSRCSSTGVARQVLSVPTEEMVEVVWSGLPRDSQRPSSVLLLLLLSTR